MHRGGLQLVSSGPGARERDPDDQCGGDADAPEFATLLCVAEPKERKAGLSERLGEEPATCEEWERLPQRCPDAQCAHQSEKARDLDCSERQRCPARLVANEAVVGLRVERNSEPEHQP